MEINDKVIIVTGASQGIGLALAKILFALGAKVVLAARSKELLDKLEHELPGSFAIKADMRKPKDITNLIEETLARFDRIDILVNNAGQAYYGPVESIDVDNYQSIIELNIHGPLRAMQAVIPQMRKQGGGMILNVSSMVSKNYFPYLGAYASTKYALNAISLTARQELAKDDIIVSVFHPKMTATNFGRNCIGARPDFSARPSAEMPKMDSAEAVAERIVQLIRSEEPEAAM
jgi:short-subunit dehydrogenase